MGRAHAHDPFAVSVVANAAFVVVEVIAGLAGGSVALLADAGHNLSDVLGLALAWGAARLATRKPSPRRTYGLGRTTILAALSNALLLLLAVGALAWEAIGRLRSGAHPSGPVMIGVALAGIVVNGGSAVLFSRTRATDANVRGAFLHLVADAGISAGVLVAGVVVVLTGWTWIDPIVTLLISAAIAVGTWSLLRDALNLALDAVPEGIEPEDVRAYLEGLPGVCAVHDLHIWAMSTTENAVTAHIVVDGPFAPELLRAAEREMDARFGIHHVTLQVEPTSAPGECARAGEGVL